jgi:four helix bundle protein
MSHSNFRNLRVWQLARVLARDIYSETKNFPREEMYGLTQQMRRASISVLCNIAEGQGRSTHAEARRFAVIARGSLFEIEAQLVIAADLHYIPTDRAELMIDQTIEVIQKLNALIHTYDT